MDIFNYDPTPYIKPHASDSEIGSLADHYAILFAMIKAFIEVESGNVGFSQTTGRIIIQFESAYFRRFASREYSVFIANKERTDLNTKEKNVVIKWQQILNNKVENQEQEWITFNNAWTINQQAAMKCTSIGMMQIMGFHYTTLGFNSVDEMWDYAKKSEINQIELALRFIKSNPRLLTAVNNKDFQKIAYYYNGAGYARNNYDKKLRTSFLKWNVVGAISKN